MSDLYKCEIIQTIRQIIGEQGVKDVLAIEAEAIAADVDKGDERPVYQRMSELIEKQFAPLLGRYFKNSSYCFRLQDYDSLCVGVQGFKYETGGYMNGGTRGRCDSQLVFFLHAKIRLSYNAYVTYGVDILGAEEISEAMYRDWAKTTIARVEREFLPR